MTVVHDSLVSDAHVFFVMQMLGRPRHDALRRKVTSESAALALHTLDRQRPVMSLQGVLDDGEAETRSAEVARATRVDAIEPLGQPRDVLGGDAYARIPHGDVRARRVGPPAQIDAALG